MVNEDRACCPALMNHTPQIFTCPRAPNHKPETLESQEENTPWEWQGRITVFLLNTEKHQKMPSIADLNSLPPTVMKLGYPKPPTVTQTAPSTVPKWEQPSRSVHICNVLLSWEEDKKLRFPVKVILKDSLWKERGMETATLKTKLETLDIFRNVWCLFVTDCYFFFTRMLLLSTIFVLLVITMCLKIYQLLAHNNSSKT